jgi:protein-S-isoprenylcysteine O-methyltransferase Ste14
MHLFIGIAFESVWGLTVLVWMVGIFRSKRAARRSSLLSRFLLLAPIAIGYTLVALHAIRPGWLNLRFWPHTQAVEAAGLALTVLGCGFAIWARISLGSNWSARPSVKEGHELIVRGPYGLVRHPIYSGLLLALAGSALAVDRSGCILGWILVFATYAVKIRQEEQLMLQTFPQDYPAYRQRVRALIPYML